MTELFRPDPRCVRFGVADRQQGGAERLALDDRTAVVTTLIGCPDRAIEGRQSQTGVRFPEG